MKIKGVGLKPTPYDINKTNNKYQLVQLNKSILTEFCFFICLFPQPQKYMAYLRLHDKGHGHSESVHW